jgi:gluconokinase
MTNFVTRHAKLATFMILVLDLGSSSTRAMLFDEQANLIEGSVARRPSQFNADNEDNPEAALQRAIEVVEELHAITNNQSANNQSTTNPNPITHIGLSCYATSLLALDENRNPLTPIYTYADARPADDARALRQQHDELATLHRTGCRIRANYWPAKLAWLKRTQPDVFARARWFCSLPEFVCWRLFGTWVAGISIASWTGLLNREQGDWDGAWLQALQIKREQLSPVARTPLTPSPSPVRTGEGRSHSPLPRIPIRGRGAGGEGRWPMLNNAVLHPAVGDGAAANIGSGCIDISKIAVTIGTTAAMRVVRPISNLQSPISSPALWNYRVDQAHELTGGATTEGGSVFAWAQRALNLSPHPQPLSQRERGVSPLLLGEGPGVRSSDIEHALNRQQPDAHGLTVLPMFAGERSPGYAEDVRATLHGLSLDTSPIEITRALIESVAYRLAMIHDSLRELAAPNAVLVGSGGALVASPTWCQIIADVTNTPLLISDEAEATAKGVAMLASLKVGRLEGWDGQTFQPSNLQTLKQTFKPVLTHHKIYRAAMARQQELYDKLI